MTWQVRGRHRGAESINLPPRCEQPGLVKAQVGDEFAVGQQQPRCPDRRDARQKGRSHPCGWVRRRCINPLDERDAGIAGDLLRRGLAGLPWAAGRARFVEEDDIGLEVGELRGDERAPALPLPREAPDDIAMRNPRRGRGALCRIATVPPVIAMRNPRRGRSAGRCAELATVTFASLSNLAGRLSSSGVILTREDLAIVP